VEKIGDHEGDGGVEEDEEGDAEEGDEEEVGSDLEAGRGEGGGDERHRDGRVTVVAMIVVISEYRLWNG